MSTRPGYYDSTTASADMTNFTSLNMEIGHYDPDDGRSPYRDKEESDPLSYNSRPFNTNSFKGFSETRYDRSDEYTGIRKRSFERQDSSVLYDDYYGDHDTNESSLYPTRSAIAAQDPTQLVNRCDYSYGLDRQWNTNSVNYNSYLPSKGKLLPKVPIKSYNVINHRENASTFLNDAVPVASGSSVSGIGIGIGSRTSNISSTLTMTTTTTTSTTTATTTSAAAAAATSATSKRARQLPVVSATRKRLPRVGQSNVTEKRLLPQMPANAKSKYASLMSRSDTEYTKFGIHEEFERRGAMSAMQYKDYSYSPSSKAYEPYDDTAKSMNEPSIFHSNDSLNTTAQSVFSDYSAATADRRNKISAISSAIPVVSSLTNNVNNQQLTDPYQNYTPSTSEYMAGRLVRKTIFGPTTFAHPPFTSY